jgi:YihY family inner membrane protein
MASQHVLRHPASQRAGQQAHGGSLKERIAPLAHFWQKLSNDWIFNLAGLLAYNFLMSIFPILLALLAIAGFILNAISPGSEQQLVNAIAGALPGGASGTGGVIVKVAISNLQRQAGVLFVVGLVMAIFTGSRLFVTIENCFGIVFRLRGRKLIRQNIMAIGMLLLYIVLAPIVFLASIIPGAIVSALQANGAATGFAGVLIHLVGLLAAFLVALLLFAAIYIVVPNRPVHFYEVWKGTLVAAVLLVLYELVFPIYQSIALKSNSYGSVAGFAIVILVFFYYLAVILLLGAEINSWASGQRETSSDIASMLHEVQAHNTTRGAAGPTAGEPQEDLENHEGAPAMETRGRAKEHEHDDHRGDTRPETVQPGKDASDSATNQPADQRTHVASDNDRTQTTPYVLEPGETQPHQTVPLASRREQWPDRPAANARRNIQRAVSVALVAGVAATAFWLQRRR